MNAEQILEDLVRLLKDVQDGKGTLGQFLTDEELYTEVTELVRQTAARTLSRICCSARRTRTRSPMRSRAPRSSSADSRRKRGWQRRSAPSSSRRS